MDRQPYTFPFTEEEMREIEADAAAKREREESLRLNPATFWILTGLYTILLLMFFNEPLEGTPAYMSVLVLFFPASGLSWLTCVLLPKSKTP